MRGVVVAWTRVVVGEMVMYSGYILKAQPAGFADVLYVECVCVRQGIGNTPGFLT